MVVRVKIKTTEDNYVHFDTQRNNYTLCGLETGNDETMGISKAITTKQKVNCPHCIRIVEFCHKIKRDEFI